MKVAKVSWTKQLPFERKIKKKLLCNYAKLIVLFKAGVLKLFCMTTLSKYFEFSATLVATKYHKPIVIGQCW
jgi:hypothetical protein